ncbi:MAG: HAMP domain-containing histidine kinase [Peptococcaceae bacterium]|nr:HAMP domain-containing histidine kinase [Peptococcaceae bacterium]
MAIKLKRKRSNAAEYEKFKRKIFLQSACIMGLSILIIGAAYRFVWRGNAGDWLVSFFQRVFHMRRGQALDVYRYVFRQNFEIIFIGATAITFIVLLRFALERFTRYFESINHGINALIEGDGNSIALMPEMEAIENKLNTVRLTLEQRSRDAQLAEQRKNDLVMYLAHDIKTPLTSIIGYLSLLDEAPDTPAEQKAQYGRIALDKAYRLEQLIDEFFEITRYNLQTVTLTKKNIDLYYMLAQVADEFYPQLAAGGKQAVIHAPEDLTVSGDPDKLARVFNNILKNAAAYSDGDSVIDITAGLSGDVASITFRNAGSIPKDKLAAVFEKFYRLDGADFSDKSGAGLGLAIAKEIIAQHGGRIYAESDDHSTTFTVELPAG